MNLTLTISTDAYDSHHEFSHVYAQGQTEEREPQNLRVVHEYKYVSNESTKAQMLHQFNEELGNVI